MKKIILTILLMFGLILPSFAGNIMPEKSSIRYTKTIGLYQVSNDIILYKEPSEQSKVVQHIKWNRHEVLPENLTFENLFVVFIPAKSLALMAVSDETEEWVEVIYDNVKGSRGWIKKDDPYRFMSWVTFYNMYGKKYGLYILKGAPDNVKDIRSATEDNAQIVARINVPVKINLNVIRGNWALVSVMDLDKTPKTGYVRWRGNDGVRYLFPAIK